ncbi:MAG: hypothetical protein ABII96_05680 [Candidatus Zixiibacteriota bacterium]
MNRRRENEYSNLAVVRLAHSAGILPSHTRRFISFLGKAYSVENHVPVWGSKQLARKALAPFYTPLFLPRKIAQKLLELPGWCGNFLGIFSTFFRSRGIIRPYKYFMLHFLPSERQKKPLNSLLTSNWGMSSITSLSVMAHPFLFFRSIHHD